MTRQHAVEVVEAGLANTVQDRGRFGHRAIGVPPGGAADALLLACANRLAGNADDAAAIEMPLAGPALRALDGPVRVALMGAVQAQVLRAGGAVDKLDGAHSATLERGDVLRVGAVRAGVAYLALSGGCQVPACLASRSTYARARLGGVAGRPLAAGDLLPCGAPEGDAELQWRAGPWRHEQGPVRVMPGPQDEAFEPAAIEDLLQSDWRVGRETDRMGMRLEGPALAHRGSADLTSEGVVPGAIQVPGNGQPIVLLADAQTVGGYPKIACVIRADLPRLAHLRPGDVLRFAAVDRAQALEALRAQADALARWAATIAPWRRPGSMDLEALGALSLVSGMIDARSDTLPWE